jgi:hypothetical protein
MFNRRGFGGKRLPVMLAFGVIVAAAIGVGCKGFFQSATLNSITIQPPNPSVQVGLTLGLQAWGTFSDNSREQIKSGVAWSTSDNSTVSIDPNSGIITGQGSGGTATITAAAQGLSATTTATSFLGTITNFQVCSGTFDTGTCPATTWTVSGTSGGSQDFYSKGLSNGTKFDLTTGSTWSVSPNPQAGSIDCTNNGSSPEVCTVGNGTTTGTYTLTVTYGTSNSATVSIVVD